MDGFSVTKFGTCVIVLALIKKKGTLINFLNFTITGWSLLRESEVNLGYAFSLLKLIRGVAYYNGGSSGIILLVKFS